MAGPNVSSPIFGDYTINELISGKIQDSSLSLFSRNDRTTNSSNSDLPAITSPGYYDPLTNSPERIYQNASPRYRNEEGLEESAIDDDLLQGHNYKAVPSNSSEAHYDTASGYYASSQEYEIPLTLRHQVVP